MSRAIWWACCSAMRWISFQCFIECSQNHDYIISAFIELDMRANEPTCAIYMTSFNLWFANDPTKRKYFSTIIRIWINKSKRNKYATYFREASKMTSTVVPPQKIVLQLLTGFDMNVWIFIFIQRKRTIVFVSLLVFFFHIVGCAPLFELWRSLFGCSVWVTRSTKACKMAQ